MGVSCGYVCGDSGDDKMKEGFESGEFQLLFFTPEALLLNRKWRRMICSDKYQCRLRGLVIDEAHTIKKWSVMFNMVISVIINYYLRILFDGVRLQ